MVLVNFYFAVGTISLLLVADVRADENVPHNRNKRATVGDRSNLWTNGTVYYSFDSGLSPRLESLLKEAMMEWQNKSCLKFQARDQEADYVKFNAYPNEEYCTCDSVGRRGGQQEIKLGYSCHSKGELLHTVGHVIGLWNEQARPDRDKYVRVLNENIDEGQEKCFVKRNEFTIDYQGSDYDYESIMHLGTLAYSKNGNDTTETLQGDHAIGQREKLSDEDILRVNTLYHCPSKRVKPGKLRVAILNVTLNSLLNANPRVEVTAIDSGGDEITMHTTEKKIDGDDNKDTEEEFLEFPSKEPKDWQFFRVRILGEVQEKDQLAASATVHIIPGRYSKLKHCINESQDCEEFIEYRYEYIEDGDECSPNPCNEGSCTDLFANFTCTCSSSYYGDLCEHDRCEENPCENGGTCVLDPATLRGYNCTCSFSYHGERCQHNRCDPHPCQNGRECELDSINPSGYVCNCGNSYFGHLCQHNRCGPNPCQNGGICRLDSDKPQGYTCTCSSSYHGDRCQHNRCVPNPCQNGQECQLISTNPSGYVCNCGNSYFGDLCQHNRCGSNPCQNGGICRLDSDKPQGYTCTCSSSYHGDRCQHNRCIPNPCQNGRECQLTSTNSRGYVCNCGNSYYGDLCQRNRCSPNPCQHSGTCQLNSHNPHGYTCDCASGYYGNQCQNYDHCYNNPCQNGARCSLNAYNANGYTCQCSSYYYGSQCQHRDHCYPNPCRNSGSCDRRSQGYSCRCRSGYTGDNCEVRRGRLRLYIRYGHGLQDRDGWLQGDSDPYTHVEAYDSDGHRSSLHTRTRNGNENPAWNQWLDFGVDTWTRFGVKVYDQDGWLGGSDDSLSTRQTYYLTSHTTRNDVRMNCNRGYIVFDYEYNPA